MLRDHDTIRILSALRSAVSRRLGRLCRVKYVQQSMRRVQLMVAVGLSMMQLSLTPQPPLQFPGRGNTAGSPHRLWAGTAHHQRGLLRRNVPPWRGGSFISLHDGAFFDAAMMSVSVNEKRHKAFQPGVLPPLSVYRLHTL